MNRGRHIALVSLLGLWSALSFAANYPASYITTQLKEAHRPVFVALSNLKPGDLRVVRFLERPVWVYRRTKKDLSYLRSAQRVHVENLESRGFRFVVEDQYLSSRDEAWVRLLMVTQPLLEQEPYRSFRDEYLIVSGLSPLGCALRKASSDARPSPVALFFDPCAGTWFDAAGRMLSNDWTPPRSRAKELAGADLLIPPHYFASSTRLAIGVNATEVIPEVDFRAIRARFYARTNPAERLARAAAYNDIDEVRRGIAAGALRRTSPTSPNPVNGAILGGSMELIELLLKRGARPDDDSHDIAELLRRSAVVRLLEKIEAARP